VASKEGIQAEPEALNVIAQKADGGMRDALSIFDQVASFTGGNITYQGVIQNLNVLDYEYYFRLTDFFLENKASDTMLLLNEVLRKGFDAHHFITGLASHFRDLLVSKDPITLPLLEVGASIRERYQQQAQKCEQKFLYRAMKLCNDCDLNYRTSKNKRLLVELTLIQCAQLTLPDADDLIGGRSPRRRLKPLFTQPIVISTPTPAQPQVGGVAGKQSPLPEIKTEKRKIPVMKLGTGISIRNHQSQEEKKQAATPTHREATVYQEDYQDHIFYEKDLKYYWREFAQQKLPIEEKANAARMMNMSPKLLDDTTFEVGVDNGMVEKYMNQLLPAIQAHLRERLHNRKITMKVRVFEAKEVVRAYSPVERFQLMSKKNPKLMKLKEIFGLELS
jgi:DNA polymerase-3 subunit gamma/tau